MKKALALFLAVLVSACDRMPESQVKESPGAGATPVQNAPQTTPIPIQPITATPEMPRTTPIPTPVSTPAESGTATETPTPTPADSPTPTPTPAPVGS